ncbi:MAG: hypothetical protein ACOZCO_00995 [Bacteroidota bacterium]
MKKNIKAVLVLIVALAVCPVISVARNAKSDFSACQDFYKKAVNLYMEIDVTNFESEKDKSGTLLGMAVMQKSREAYYSKFLNDELVSSGKNILIIDHGSRHMSFFTDPGKPFLSPFTDMDSLFRQMKDSIVFTGISGGVIKYSVFPKKGMYKKIEVCFNEKKLYLQQLTYWYHPSSEEFSMGVAKTAIHYKKVTTSLELKNVFDISRFVAKANGKYKPADAYKKYSLKVIEPKKK